MVYFVVSVKSVSVQTMYLPYLRGQAPSIAVSVN